MCIRDSYGLDHIAAALDGAPPALEAEMDAVMVAKPVHWQAHVHGAPDDLRRERHFGYADRIRYYWPDPAAQSALARLDARLAACLGGRGIPETLVSQYLAALYPEVAAGRLEPTPHALAIAAVQRVLRQYRAATHPT